MILLVKKILVIFSKSFGRVQTGYIPILVPIGQRIWNWGHFMALRLEVHSAPFSLKVGIVLVKNIFYVRTTKKIRFLRASRAKFSRGGWFCLDLDFCRGGSLVLTQTFLGGGSHTNFLTLGGDCLDQSPPCPRMCYSLMSKMSKRK